MKSERKVLSSFLICRVVKIKKGRILTVIARKSENETNEIFL